MHGRVFAMNLPARAIGILMILVLVAGCGAAVSVHRADLRTVHRDLTRSVLTTGELSEHTQNVLHRHGFDESFRKKPDVVLTRLAPGGRRKVREGPDAVFALAELSFFHAERGHKRPSRALATDRALSGVGGLRLRLPLSRSAAPRCRIASTRASASPPISTIAA